MARLKAFDSFTETGTGFLGITSHTPEAGGTWSGGSQIVVDRDNDYVTASNSTALGGAAQLQSAAAWNCDVSATVGFFGGTASGRIVGISGRVIDTTNMYMAACLANGQVRLYCYTAASYTAITTVTGSTTAAIRAMRFRITGSSPTSLRVRVWDPTSAEPNTWDIDTTDNTAANQTTNATGCGVYLEVSGSTRVNYTYVDNLTLVELTNPPVFRTQAVTRAAVI